MGSVLPEGWKQVCTKGHTTEHSSKCTHWICPQGRRYKEWSEVQAYFQLLHFEEDIPGVECRPENAKKIPLVEDVEDEVTLEEATKKEMEDKINKTKNMEQLKRKRTTNDDSSESGGENDNENKGKKKGKVEDEDYQPIKDSKVNDKKSPKKTRRSIAAAAAAAKTNAKENFKCNQCKSVFLSNNDLQNHTKTAHKTPLVKTTLDETPDIPKKSDNIVPLSKKSEPDIPKKSDKLVPLSKKSEPKVVDKVKKSVPPAVVDVIDLDSPSKKVSNNSTKLDKVKEVNQIKVAALEQLPKEKEKKPLLSTKSNVVSTSTKATITPVQPATGKSNQAVVKSLNISQPATKPALGQQSKQISAQVKSLPQVGQQTTAIVQNKQVRQTSTGTAEKTPQVQQKQSSAVSTPQSQAKIVQLTPQTRQQSQVVKQGTPRQVTPLNPRTQTPQANTRQVTPQSRQTTPQVIQKPQNLPSSTKRLSLQPEVQEIRQQTPRAQTPRQQTPQVRGVQPSTQPRQTLQPKQQTPQPRQQKPQVQANVQVRQQQPAQAKTTQVQQKSVAPQQQQPQPKLPQFTELPTYLKSLVNFSCKLETNAGGGPSLYRAASQHTGLGQEGWQELRKYCHVKLTEWWQWYEPYYAFPLQVKIRMRNQTVQKTIPSSVEFVKFLKTEESLSSFHMSECELYCLANILGVPIYQLTYNLVGVGGKPEERCRWDTLDPHQGLIHQNKFNTNKDPLYLLYEDKVHFCKIVQTK